MHNFFNFLHRVTGCCCISVVNAAIFYANRNVILKISILSILCYYWMQVVAEKFSVCFTFPHIRSGFILVLQMPY